MTVTGQNVYCVCVSNSLLDRSLNGDLIQVRGQNAAVHYRTKRTIMLNK